MNADPLRFHQQHLHLISPFARLTEQTAKLTEQVELLTREMHRRICASE